MIAFETLKATALSFPNAMEAPHFENLAFKVNKKIFATYNPTHQRATVKLNAIDQQVFVKVSEGAINAVPNKWGKQGWTNIDLNTVHPDLCIDAFTTAYCTVAPPALALQVRPE